MPALLGYSLFIIHIFQCFVSSSQHLSTFLALSSSSSSTSSSSLMMPTLDEEMKNDKMNELIKNSTTIQNDRITIQQYLSQFIDLRQLNTISSEQNNETSNGNNNNNINNNVISLGNRKFLCQKLILKYLQNNSNQEDRFLQLLNNEHFLKLLNIEHSQFNDSMSKEDRITRLINHSCILESSEYFGKYYHIKWSNSTERYLSKTILKDTLIPIINFVNILTMICLNCPVYSILSRKNTQISIWFMLTSYSILKTLHIFISDLPRLIVNLLILYSNYMTEQTDLSKDNNNNTTDIYKNISSYQQSSSISSNASSIIDKLKSFHGLQNLGLIPCSLFTFLECVLEYTPNWIMVILVWEQIVRFIVMKPNSSSVNDSYCPLYAYHYVNNRKRQQKKTNSQISQQSNSDFVYRIREDNGEIVGGGLSTTTTTSQQQQQQCNENYSQSITVNKEMCNKKDLSNCNVNIKVKHYSNTHYQTYTNVNTDSLIDNLRLLMTLFKIEIYGGLTLFGAKLITITIIVLQVFLNVHSIWLHHYSKKQEECRIDLDEHSPIFTYVYPYLLRVIHCSVPNFGCFIGVIVYIVYFFNNHKRNKSQPVNIMPKVKYDSIDLRGPSVSNEGDCEGLITSHQLEDDSLAKLTSTTTSSLYKTSDHNKMFKVVRIKDCSILLSCSLTPRQSRLYDAQMIPASENSAGNCNNSCHNELQKKEGKKLSKHSISFWSKTSFASASATYSTSSSSSTSRSCSILKSINTGQYLGLILAIFQVIFNVPADILWYCEQHLKVVPTSDNVAYFYRMIKIWHLVDYSIQCWTTLQLCILFWLTFIFSPTVRHQCRHVYCNCKQFYCTQKYFTCGFCGYNCL